ncbi:MAG TPA: MucR family transcriptional regulator [Allosphingosinicella sp.]|nr:MucR family transcriptional regulator [Allosphingosinicella sp.]
MTVDRETLLYLTADIVSAHVANNHVSPGDMAELIANVHGAMSSLGPVAEEPPTLKGAVPVRASIKPDYLISLIDGRRYKMLRGHLRRHGYTPESYRAAYGLPYDYPMVSPRYSELRRAVAHKIGLGRRPKT